MTDTDIPLADPALYGLEGRVPGSPCQTRCTPDCTSSCHERHHARPSHDQFYCDQIRVGRDVSEFEPEVRRRWEADVRARRALAEQGLFGALFSTPEDGGNLFDEEPGSFGHGVPRRARMWLWVKGRAA